jgi:Xaa-Pro aminopeptidase
MDEMPLKQWLAKNHIHYLAFESEKTTYERYQQLTQEAVHLQPVSSLVQQLRLIKDADEIMLLEQAAHLGYQGYEYTLSLLKNGISEAELAFELELFWRRRGAKKLAFETIIAFGVNASMPHYRAGETRFIPQMPVLIDSGVIWHHYHSDMTRVILPQEPSMELKTMYKAVAEAKQAALSACQPGCLIGDLDKIARHILKTYNYESYFTHSLGHGIGLDIHEPPTIRSIGKYASLELQTGMVITIEPGVYIPSVGGVRLEDTILITETGFKNFYNFNKT